MIRTTICLLALVLAGLLMYCSTTDDPATGEQQTVMVDTMGQRPIDSVLADVTDDWMTVPGVVGTGIGECDGQPCIKVFVASRTTEVDTRIPKAVEGYPVEVQVTGEFKAHDSL